MVIKVRRSFLFGDVEPTDNFIRSILGTPITDKNKQIGVIVGYNKEKDLFSFDIDDDYKEQLTQNMTCSMEIRNG